VSFSVEAGQITALIGRSGSGKSTLLNLISGLEPIQSGQVQLGGHTLTALSDSQRTKLRGAAIGFIYQAFNLIPTLTVADNISLPLALAKVSRKEISERVSQQLANVGLGNRGQDYPDQLSGGEQQRVAIARALVHRPALILADEPTGNLDASSGRQALKLLEELVLEQQSALLIVTHSNEVATAADRILMLDQGKVFDVDSSKLASSGAW